MFEFLKVKAFFKVSKVFLNQDSTGKLGRWYFRMILRLIAKLAKLSDGWFPNYQYSFEIDDITFFFNFQIFVLHSNLVNSFSDVAFFTQGNVNII